MKCEDLATYVARNIVPQITDAKDREVLTNVIKVLNSEPVSCYTPEDLDDDCITSILWGKDDLRRELENLRGEPLDEAEVDEKIRKYFPGDFSSHLCSVCVGAGHEAILDTALSVYMENEKGA